MTMSKVEPATPSATAANATRARSALGSSRPRLIVAAATRSEEHTSELPSLMRISYAVFCLKKKKHTHHKITITPSHNNKFQNTLDSTQSHLIHMPHLHRKPKSTITYSIIKP